MSTDNKTIELRKGLDLPISGEPVQEIKGRKSVRRVGVLGLDYLGLRPTMRVEVGVQVRRGQVLFEDKKNPGIYFTAPGAGTVIAINRGERRVLLSVVIDLNEREQSGNITEDDVVLFSVEKTIDELSGEELRRLLARSGLWVAFRTRPFSKVPRLDSNPHSIFVTVMDTNPLAASPSVVLREKYSDFLLGLRAITKLTEGTVYVCKSREVVEIPVPNLPQVCVVDFRGPHPAGTPGVHIHFLDPVHRGKTVWHIYYQDVCAIGELIRTGILPVDRIISLAGPSVKQPRLLTTRIGAAIDELVAGEIKEGEHRVISGSVLSGRKANGEIEGYLGRYHYQVSVVPEGRQRRFLGWLAPGFDQFSVMPIFVSRFFPKKRFAFTTNLNGGRRAMVPVGLYEKVMPMDILPTFLLRALLTNDIEQAEALGCLELDEEDLALCTFVCPSKIEYGPALRRVLEVIEQEG